MSGARGPLRDARFQRLLLGETLASFAVTALYLALGIWAKALTDSNALAGSVFLALGVPTLLAPLVGHLVDRVKRRPLMIITYAGLALALLSLLTVHTRAQLWVIYLVAAAVGFATDITSGSRGALLKDMLPTEQLGAANAAVQTMGQGMQLVSPLVGAGLYTWLGGPGLTVFEVTVLALSVGALASVRITESAPEPAVPGQFAREVLAGFGHLRSVAVLRQLALFSALAFCVLGLCETVGFAVVDQGLHRAPAFYGVLTSVQGVGSLVGGILTTRVLRPLGETRLVGTSLAVVAVGFAGMISSALPVVLVGMALIGLGIPWFIVGLNTAVQRHTPPRLQGRVGATTGMLLTGPQTASIAVGAALINVVDYRILLVVIVVGMIASGLQLLIRPAAPPVAESIITVGSTG